MLAYIKLTGESVFVPMQGDGCSFLIRENVQEFREEKKHPMANYATAMKAFFWQYGGCFHGFMCILLLRKRVFRFQSETQWLAVEY